MSVRGGRIVLPDGMSYRVLVLPDRPGISLPVLRKLKELVKAGATVIGPKPTQTYSLTDYPQCDAEVARLADELWGEASSASPLQRRFGKGRVIYGKTAREVLGADGVKPDFDYTLRPQPPAPTLAARSRPRLHPSGCWRRRHLLRCQPLGPLGGGGLHIPRDGQSARAVGPGQRDHPPGCGLVAEGWADHPAAPVCAVWVNVCCVSQTARTCCHAWPRGGTSRHSPRRTKSPGHGRFSLIPNGAGRHRRSSISWSVGPSARRRASSTSPARRPIARRSTCLRPSAGRASV